jgi:hypothetical protein
VVWLQGSAVLRVERDRAEVGEMGQELSLSGNRILVGAYTAGAAALEDVAWPGITIVTCGAPDVDPGLIAAVRLQQFRTIFG